jgi:hypothetical protein
MKTPARWVLAYGLFLQPFIGFFFKMTVLELGTLIHYSWTWPAITGAGLTIALIFQIHKTNIVAYGRKWITTYGGCFCRSQ